MGKQSRDEEAPAVGCTAAEAPFEELRAGSLT
jgi:hypothetical protein